MVSINEVALRQDRLVLGWATLFGWAKKTSSVCNQPPRSTHPGYSFMGRHNEY